MILTFAKWMQKNKKELANIPAEKLAQHLEQQLQTEEGVAELAPYLEAFEKEIKSSPMGMMYASGGSMRKKELGSPARYGSPLFQSIPDKEESQKRLDVDENYDEHDYDIDVDDHSEDQKIDHLKKILEDFRKQHIPLHKDDLVLSRFKNKVLA